MRPDEGSLEEWGSGTENPGGKAAQKVGGPGTWERDR